MNSYKMTKAIRFKLETSADGASEMLKEAEALQTSFNLAKFISQVKNFMAGMQEYLFRPEKDKHGSLKLKGDFTIKKEWLKTYSKAELAAIKEKQSQNPVKRRQPTKLADLKEASEKVIQAFTESENALQELIKDMSAELNERAKRERTGLLVKRLHAKNALPLLIALIENINSKSETSDLRINLIWYADELKTQLPLALAAFLPAQSEGIPVAKATLNYYTLNKKPTDYNQKIQEQIKKLPVQTDNTIFNIAKNKISNGKIQKGVLNDIQAEMKKNNATQLLLGDVPPMAKPNYTYISLRQVLKNIKAKQKSQFNELLTLKDTTLQTLKSKPELYLFHNITEQQFKEYKKKTDILLQITTDLNQKGISEERKQDLRSQKQKIAKQRGDLLKDTFHEWKNFMELYRTVAQRHGKILATLKGIEKEQVESQLLKYWAIILEENGQHKLVLIPREKAKEAYEWIKKNKVKSDTQNIQHRLYWFESFTYKSLQKLCFDHADTGSNSFKPNIEDLFNKYGIQGEFSFEGDEQRKINFYKDVLKHNYTRNTLNLPFEQIDKEIINKKFDTLEDFQTTLEKICYKRFASFTQSPERLFRDYKAEIFTITAYDLTKKSPSKDKHHTQIWKQFWSAENEKNYFDVRINPEMTITYRLPKSSRVYKYGKESKLYDPNKKNRYLHPQFTLITTMSEHSHAPAKTLSFTTEDEFKELLDDFNRKFRKENIKFALGIDNGETELSTLGVFLPDFAKDTPEARFAELQNVQKYGFDVLTIKDLNYSEKDYNGKERKIIQNPSYFLVKENYMRTFGKTEQEYTQMFSRIFEKRRLLTLDLTTAKVIAGHIVTNGDVPALFNLWMRHAQRNIYEMNDHIKQETAKKIILKNQLGEQEKWKFLEKISDPKEYQKLSYQDKQRYFKWIFEDRNENTFTKQENDKFKKVQKRVGNFSENSGVVYAVSAISGEVVDIADVFDIRNVFKKRQEFFSLMSENDIITRLNEYNTSRTTHNISNEELDLRIKNLKEALVANAVGVIDFLYKEYKKRTNGEGLIVKEGFDSSLVEQGLEKFSGNIYRILERKLYQKFQNYGLVPPIKSLLSVRGEGIKSDESHRNAIMRLGNIAFVSPFRTSQQCPKCLKENMKHGKECPDCNFRATPMMHSNDGIAGFNIAKRGLENFQNPVIE